MELLADSEKFPDGWLFKHRWGKGKKNKPAVLPNGDKIVYLTVGGRTSAVVPSVQKKTGPVAKDVSDEDRKRPAALKEETDSEAVEDGAPPKKRATNGRSKNNVKKEEIKEEKATTKGASKAKGQTVGRRQSTRRST